MKEKIRIALADDEDLFRKGIAALIEKEADLKVVYEAESGKEILQYLKKTTLLPEVILMDLNMEEINGVEATKAVVENYPSIKIIALTSYDSQVFIKHMLAIGVAAYVVKNTTSKALINIIKQVASNGFYYSPKVLSVLQEKSSLSRKNRLISFKEPLTHREKEVLLLICQQYSTKEIAERLFINHRTVEGHRNNLLQKTGSKNTVGLIIYAIQEDLIPLEDILKNS
ncbi:response regulator transcription factor [Mesonia sp. K7]|uniref:response regulator transcription factor n=1 Tax=Mesonia sp. K7 TaxID=2218606 RepID=UPI000DA85069|nr:response regulator transcription factor [Mesonia sp. K7]PZD77131.1 DNA-binding response regulator [Mesonia sp. K7]